MPKQVKQRSRIKTRRSPNVTTRASSALPSTEPAGGRTVTLESSTVASTPAGPVDEPVKPRRRAGKAAASGSSAEAAAVPESFSAEKSVTPENSSEEPIIRQKSPAIDVTLDEILEECEKLEAGKESLCPEQGIAQLEEHVVRNGGDTGSRPVPLIEHPQGKLKGDQPLLEDAIVAPPAAPYAGGEHELQPTLDAEVPIAPPKRKIVKTYEYTDEEGTPLYEVVRYSSGEPRFLPRHRVDNKWVYSLAGLRKVPYRLHDYAKIEGQTVFVVEGEKDVDTARELGFIATCSSNGANGWHKKYAEYLHKHTVVIIPDNDDAGEVYADAVATSIDGIAVDYRIVRLPDLPPKGDLTYFIERGGTKDDVLRLVEKAFAAPRPQPFALYEAAGDTLGRTNGKPSQSQEPEWQLISRCFADIEREEINWLWKGMWMNHTLNALIGPPGTGKTFVSCHLAAAVSRGMPFPDGGGTAPLGDVVYCTTEDSLGAVIRPRLEEAGADIKRIHTWEVKTRTLRSGERVEEEISLQDADLLLSEIDKKPELRLIILDPIFGYLGGVEANNNQEVRPLLQELRKIAESKKICILFVSHPKKGASSAIDAASGAGAFGQVPRVSYYLQRDPDDPERRARCLSPIKCNNGPDTVGKIFRLAFQDGGAGPGHIVWDASPDERSVDEIRAATIQKNCATGRASNEEKSSVQSEIDFIKVLDALQQPDDKWVPTIDVRRALGWNGVKFPKVLFQLERSERVEVRCVDMTMPNGAVKRMGREEVRKRAHGPY